ncbi:hypothetical protein GCM10027275_06840 [Rhabdobacter roseus]|uniref:DUF2490 domain-containing protein n=1 Tax=Rhabdobacter roseus TaxID=1655419 RepID=A0A840TH55_9BACT|nr:hypothetical protein [Rhabdobacter roseus]MBB5282581.1 hypothetical protein [Rhabdobacter roseus]
MKTFPLLVLLLFLLPFFSGKHSHACAQDSLSQWKIHLDRRASFLGGNKLNLWGGSIGRTWGPMQHELTLGYYWAGGFGRRQLSRTARERALDQGLDYYYRSDLFFGRVGYWHSFLNRKRWKIGAPVELGLGRAVAERFSLDEESLGLPEERYWVVPLSVAGYGEWVATRWVGLGLQAGYRRDLQNRVPVPINGLYYRIRVLVYLDTYFDWRDFVFRGKPLRSPFFKK